ncbi:MAG: 2-dehydro-3-deoxygalactonokinase [Bacteroidia bacterium]|nr:2-dehydro-3-deoxygalactonokinase [Bacteroidia bacterium]
MELFISCDWGTTALRLRVFDSLKRLTVAEAESIQGISATYKLWMQKGEPEIKRYFFYQSILKEQISILKGQCNFSLDFIPFIISGMASSNIGIEELPYKKLPFGIEGHELNVKVFDATDEFKHKMLLISGAKTLNDAMRGEETQLIGCLDEEDKEDHLILFPGTHSKHVRVKKGQIVDIKTYMTGEFFELLSRKSILSNHVEEPTELFQTDDMNGFKKGVEDCLQSDILHTSFLVRTNGLFGKMSKRQNYQYLSGLVIGSELKQLINSKIPLTIVGNESLAKLYNVALQKLGLPVAGYRDAGWAVLWGHCKVFNLYKSKLNVRAHN